MSWSLTPAREFAAHADAWQALNRETVASPLLEPAFVQPLITEFGNGDEWLAIYRRDGRVMAMALLRRRKLGAWETFQPSQQPLGMWMQRPEAALPQLMDELLRALPGMPLVLGLTQCDPWLMPRPAHGPQLDTGDYIQTARITVAGTFDEYWAARGKNLRSNLKKQRTRLAKEGVALRMDVVRTPADMAKAVADYGVMESAGWKAQGGTAIHPDNDQGRFYRSMLENFARRDGASVYRYWFNEQLVVMNLCIEGGGAVIVLKTTYDESVSSQYSPAFLMREDSCQELFNERRFERMEFYGKLMEWHLRWTDEVRTMYHVTHYRWPALKRLHALIKNRKAGRAGAGAAAPSQPGHAGQPEPSTE
ncbi:GNAT family N-acetyltransferase [Pseudoduganella sp. LjRoot289]|uniref:GNAT family N-acetyltransferase n=1 Tax=Pseudoduganella sp. LjRoot289 TaxID=3342314 RepID=UPI003ECC5165